MASKSYLARTNYVYFPTDCNIPIGSDSMFELQESDLWTSVRSQSPEFRKSVPSSRISRKSSAKRVEGGPGTSLPVNVPDWFKILKDDNRMRRDCDEDEDEEEGDRLPPHEYLARQFARTRIASFSVHEGIGRTLKGRDLSRVRNAIWEKTGFRD